MNPSFVHMWSLTRFTAPRVLAQSRAPRRFFPLHMRMQSASMSGSSTPGSNRVTEEPTMVRARHILVDSEEMLDAIRTQIDEGKGSFADLARLVSTCSSKARGGDLGWFRRKVMVKEFEQAAFSNPPGSVVKVKSEFGWHLILVEDHGIASSSMSMDEFGSRFGLAGSDDKTSVQLIDCRETSELELAAVPDFLNLPMGEYGSWADDFEKGNLNLDPEKETIVMCHHGVRSAQFCYFLSQQGFKKARNLVGGIDAYSKTVDSSIPTY